MDRLKDRKPNSRPRKPRGNRRRDREEEDGPSDAQNIKRNDPEWYSVDPALLRDSASFPYSWPVGSNISRHPIDVSNDPKYVPLGDGYNMRLPGVATFWLVPSFGESNSPSSALNLAAQQLYTFVRHLNSGSANYDAVDLMLYIGAMASVYSYINFLQRTYGTAQIYAQKNRYLPKALLEAQGVDYDDVISNLADFRYRLNVLINKASSFAVPADITYFKRQAFNYSRVYTEGESIKDQLYVQVPARLIQFGLDADGAGQLNAVVTPMYSHWLYDPTPLATVADLFSFADDMIQPLLESEDFGIMNGDILKAYGRDKIITLAQVTPEYRVIPEFNLQVLEQFKNATLLDFFARRTTTDWNGKDPYTGYVHQSANKGYLITNNQFKLPIAAGTSLTEATQLNGIHASSGAKIISTHSADPDPTITVENTRLAAVISAFKFNYPATGNVPESVQLEIKSGSDILTYVGLHTFQADGTNRRQILHSTAVVNGSTPTTMNALNQVAEASYFEFLPQFYVASSTTGLTRSVWNISNYTVLHPQDLERLHEACMLSLLHVNQIAKLS